MHILVTNDDGVQAPGLLALARSLRALAKVTVLAPDRNWTASGHVKTLDRPLRVRETCLADDTLALSTDGAPSDCVALALLGLLPEPIDLVVSGINAGENVGHDVTYSGTVTAAMEAAIWGLPGIAVSLQHPASPQHKADFSAAAEVARSIAAQVLRDGLPKGVLLNVNVPNLAAAAIQGLRVTRQGLRIYNDVLVERLDPRQRPYYWIGGEFPTGVPEDDTDYGALTAGCISVTPLQLDLTAYASLKPLSDQTAAWTWLPGPSTDAG
jgi:5'-nucleotidase